MTEEEVIRQAYLLCFDRHCRRTWLDGNLSHTAG